LAPADDTVCRRIAQAYAALGRYAEAQGMYARAIALRPGYWENYNSSAIFFWKRGNLGEAQRLFRKVIDLRPDSDMGYSNLAGVLILAGELKAAEPLLQAAQRIHPSAAGHNNLGFVYYATGRFEEAAREFRSAIEESPNGTRWGNLGDAFRQLGRADEARAAYGRAIQLHEAWVRVNPADAEARGLLAMSLAGSGRCGEARREAAQATARATASPTVHYYAAVAHAVCRESAAAVRHAARAVEGGVVADVRTNPDLKPLLEDPSLRRLLGR
jgi:Flp pilus assembly protein TadD